GGEAVAGVLGELAPTGDVAVVGVLNPVDVIASVGVLVAACGPILDPQAEAPSEATQIASAPTNRRLRRCICVLGAAPSPGRVTAPCAPMCPSSGWVGAGSAAND